MCGMKTAKAALCALILSLGLATASPPADAQDQTGLVNVSIGDITTGDILSNNTTTVGVAANTAAQVCGIQLQAGVLSALLNQQGSFKCSNNATQKFVQVTK
jgi:class 3 adenylate cyclase